MHIRFGHLLMALLIGAGQPSVAETAHFAIRNAVVTPGLGPFGATVYTLGNGGRFTGGGGGFEPAVFRTRLEALRDAPDTVFATADTLSAGDTWPDGFLDGAEVEVLRVVNGALVTVRHDRVAAGGHHGRGWRGVLPGGQVLTGPGWEAPRVDGAMRYYTVHAVDGDGRLSAAADPVAAAPGRTAGKPRPMRWMKRDDIRAARISAPQGLRAEVTGDGVLRLDWDPVPGAAGYAVFATGTPPDTLRPARLDLAGNGPPVRAGDMVFVRHKIMAPPAGMAADDPLWQAAFGAVLLPPEPRPPVRITAHPPDSPVADPGETYLSADLAPGQPLRLGRRILSGTDQSWNPVLDPAKTYRIEAWLRGEGTLAARFESSDGDLRGLPAAVSPGPDWRRYSADFRTTRIRGAEPLQWIGLVVEGAGRIDVDNLRIYPADAPFMDLPADDRAALAASGMGMLRTHGFIKTGTRTYDLRQLLAPGGVSPLAEGDSLPQVLRIFASLGTDPWLQIEPHLSPGEWRGLAEYLAAPFDPARDDPAALPWAALRVAQGQAAPWTDVFGRIWLEIGNETWNGTFFPWTFPEMRDAAPLNWGRYSAGAVYGLYQEHVLAVLRGSPWWDRLAPRLVPLIGGWSGMPYGLDALARSPGSMFLTNGAYIGGWDAGEGVPPLGPEGFARVMANTPQEMEPAVSRTVAEVRRRFPGRQVGLGTYEGGPGYALDGLNGETVTPGQRRDQERLMKSAAAGAATLDSFLLRARLGERAQTYFMFLRGELWRSHAPWYRGGQAYPSWDWLALFNRVGPGDMLAVDTLAVPRRSIPALYRRPALENGPMAAAYATRQGDRLTVVVISRQVPGAGAPDEPPDSPMTVRIDLPVAAVGRITRYRASGDFRAENTTSAQTRILAEPLPVPDDPARLDLSGLAPASAQVLVLEGVRFLP